MIPKAQNVFWKPDPKELNELNYRCDSFYKRKDINVLSVGCSVAIGQALPLHQRWSHIFCKKLRKFFKKSVNDWNMAQSGISNDYMSRILIEAIPVLKPDLLIVIFTQISRREYMGIDGEVMNFLIHGENFGSHLNHDKFQTYHDCIKNLANPSSDLNNFYKNYKLIELLAENSKIPYMFASMTNHDIIKQHIDKGYMGEWTYNDTAEDGCHPGELSNKEMANLFMQYYCHLL